MDRLTRPDVGVDPSMDKEICGKFKAEYISDKLMHLILNGPTLNGINKDTLRALIRALYNWLKAYENIGLTPEEIYEAFDAQQRELEKLRAEMANLQKVETNIFDREEIHEGCTVQILTNTVTGEQSIGWWQGTIADRLGGDYCG